MRAKSSKQRCPALCLIGLKLLNFLVTSNALNMLHEAIEVRKNHGILEKSERKKELVLLMK